MLLFFLCVCTPRTSSVLRLHVYLCTTTAIFWVQIVHAHLCTTWMWYTLYRHHSIDAINALYFGSFLKCAVSLFPFLFDLPFRLGAKRFLFFRPPAPLAFFFLLDSTAPVDPNATSNTFSSFTSPNSRHFSMAEINVPCLSLSWLSQGFTSSIFSTSSQTRRCRLEHPNRSAFNPFDVGPW